MATGKTASSPTTLSIYVDNLPVGAIIMWAGTAAQVPQGWHLGDGSNGTPDLVNSFPFGLAARDEQRGQLHNTRVEGKYSGRDLPAHGHSGTVALQGHPESWKLMNPGTRNVFVGGNGPVTVYDRNATEDSVTIGEALRSAEVRVGTMSEAAVDVPLPTRTYVYFIMRVQ